LFALSGACMAWSRALSCGTRFAECPGMRTAFVLILALSGCGDEPPVDDEDDGGMLLAEDAGAATDQGAADDALPPLPDCPCFAGDGTYCGTAITDYGGTHTCSAPKLAQHGGDLYRCTAGAWSVATPCGAAGCYVAANGQADGCHAGGVTRKLYVVFHPN